MIALALLGIAGCYLHHERVELEPGEVAITRIDAGDDHTCAIARGGAVYCWGLAQQGQLGEGTGDPSRCSVTITEGPIVDHPVLVGTFDAFDVAAGATHTCLRTRTGYACWGTNCRGQLGDGTTTGTARLTTRGGSYDGLWAGAQHTCVTESGRLACFGGNDRGQLGLGTTSPLSEPGATEPVPVSTLDPGISDVALGFAHTCALDASGVVWCWGANGAGQLGDGAFEVRSLPAFVRGLPAARAIDVAAGDSHSCAALEHQAWCWGWNERGQLGNGIACAPGDTECSERPLPERVLFEGPVDEIDAGSQFGCLRSGGRVLCWGSNDVGQLGTGARGSSAEPVDVIGIEDAIAITCGANHACAIRAGGRVSCWGRNAQGQLGIGAGEDELAPVAVRFPSAPP